MAEAYRRDPTIRRSRGRAACPFRAHHFLFVLGLAISACCVLGNESDPVAVSLTVQASEGLPITGAYVALVAPDRPLWNPSAEAVTLAGKQTLTVRPGLYTVIAAADGYHESVQRIRVTASRQLRVLLSKEKRTSGEVADSAGRPVSGALVSHMRAVGPVPLGPASALARRMFAKTWTTRTDGDGRWSLPASENHPEAFLIEAAGHAGAVILASANGQRTHTVLRKGASLRLVFDRTDMDRVVTLIPTAATVIESIPAEWQPHVWSRVVDGPSIVWSSLPPGTYRVMTRALDPRRFSQARDLATVSVGEDPITETHVRLPPMEKPDADIVALFVAGKSPADLIGAQILAIGGNGADEVEHAVEPVSGGVVLCARTRSSPADLFALTRQHFIAAKETSGARSEFPLETVISGRADASLRLIADAGGADLPRWVRLRFQSCTGAQRFPAAAFVSAAGLVEFPYPSACHSVLVNTSPFEPLVLDASLEQGETRSFGDYTLKLGGIAGVRVARQPGGASVPGASVRVLSGTPRSREPMIVAEGTANEEGKILLPGLPVRGEITIEAEDPGEGLSGSVTLRLDPGKVTTVDPLPIPKAANVVIAPRLAAEFRERFPDARIRSITLDRDDPSRIRETRELNAKEEAVFERLRPGKWLAAVLLDAGNVLQPVPVELPDLVSGEQRRLDPEISPFVAEGEVTFAGATVEAMVAFSEEPSRNAMIRSVRTSDQGHFAILLPGPGIYGIEVTRIANRDERIDAGEFDLSDPRQTVRIELPDAALVVRARDAGHDAANAQVTAILQVSSLRGGHARIVQRQKTDASGEAHFESLREGRWLIEVRAGSGRSAQTFADVTHGEVAGAEVDLQPPSKLAGFVHDPNDEVVAGAHVDCLYNAPGNLPQSLHGETDRTGHFAIDLPSPPPSTMHCGATSPAGAISAYTLAPTTSADFKFPADTASLTIPDWGKRLRPDAYWLVSRDGRIFSLSWAAGTIGHLWSPLTIPGLPTGTWKIVKADSMDRWIRLVTAGGNALSPLTELSLRRGETHTVRLDSGDSSFEGAKSKEVQ
jgi:hypothetical protein